MDRRTQQDGKLVDWKRMILLRQPMHHRGAEAEEDIPSLCRPLIPPTIPTPPTPPPSLPPPQRCNPPPLPHPFSPRPSPTSPPLLPYNTTTVPPLHTTSPYPYSNPTDSLTSPRPRSLASAIPRHPPLKALPYPDLPSNDRVELLRRPRTVPHPDDKTSLSRVLACTDFQSHRIRP